jgi:8-amino-3,8-dideoxy-alpha-D-manno-octulosonate transaminase
VEGIRAQNRKLKARISKILGGSGHIGFSRLPDESGDSATFLNLMLPDTHTAKAVVAALNVAGVGGFNYWYTNMYHFINQWDHLKALKTVARLPIQILGAPQDYKNLELPKSQEVIGRLISFGIRCTWTNEEADRLAHQIRECVEKVTEKAEA